MHVFTKVRAGNEPSARAAARAGQRWYPPCHLPALEGLSCGQSELLDGPPCAGTACSKCRHARWHARVCTSVRVHPCRRMPHTAHRKPSERLAVNCSWYQSSSCCSKEDTARISQQEPEIRLLQSSRGCRDVLHMLMCSSCSPRQARAAAGSSNLHPDHGPHSHLSRAPTLSCRQTLILAPTGGALQELTCYLLAYLL